MHRSLSGILWVLALPVLGGCSLFAPAPSVSQQELPQELMYLHTVSSSNESLPMIAEWYTGEMKNWRALRAVNGDLPIFRLRIGAAVRIPSAITRQSSPMPQEFIARKKNSYRIPPRVTANHPDQSAKGEGSGAAGTQIEPPLTDESPISEELSAKDELIDNLIGEQLEGASELETTPAPLSR